MRINIKLSADEEAAVNAAVDMRADDFPITETQALRAFIRKGIEVYSEKGLLGTKLMGLKKT